MLPYLLRSKGGHVDPWVKHWDTNSALDHGVRFDEWHELGRRMFGWFKYLSTIGLLASVVSGILIGLRIGPSWDSSGALAGSMWLNDIEGGCQAKRAVELELKEVMRAYHSLKTKLREDKTDLKLGEKQRTDKAASPRPVEQLDDADQRLRRIKEEKEEPTQSEAKEFAYKYAETAQKTEAAKKSMQIKMKRAGLAKSRAIRELQIAHAKANGYFLPGEPRSDSKEEFSKKKEGTGEIASKYLGELIGKGDGKDGHVHDVRQDQGRTQAKAQAREGKQRLTGKGNQTNNEEERRVGKFHVTTPPKNLSKKNNSSPMPDKSKSSSKSEDMAPVAEDSTIVKHDSTPTTLNTKPTNEDSVHLASRDVEKLRPKSKDEELELADEDIVEIELMFWLWCLAALLAIIITCTFM